VFRFVAAGQAALFAVTWALFAESREARGFPPPTRIRTTSSATANSTYGANGLVSPVPPCLPPELYWTVR
jgi:hypothetical protein